MKIATLLTRSLHFACLQAALGGLLAAGVAWSALGAARPGFGPRLPRFATAPSEVRSLHAEPLVVSDEQLSAVLQKLRPRLNTPQPKINYVDHALRFWGLNDSPADDGCFSGEELRKLLTDDSRFTAAWGPKTRPLLRVRDGGVAIRTQQGNATASHVDHTLATLAEVGTPLDFPLVSRQGESNVGELLRQAVRTLDVNQPEYEWTVLAVALYAVDGKPWVAADGDRVDFDRLARRLMRQQYVQGVCFGNHRLYTLAALLQLNEQKPLLSSETRAEIVRHLTEATQRLVRSQAPAGHWDGGWSNPDAPARERAKESDLDDTARRLLATGHALEWWAIAPSEVQPPRETVVRAGQWLVAQVDRLDDEAIMKNYTFLTHVGRALCLWRGRTTGGASEL